MLSAFTIIVIFECRSARKTQFLRQLTSNLTDYITIQSYSHSYTINANSTISWNPYNDGIDEVDGYTPIGIVGVITNHGSVAVAHFRVRNNTYGFMLLNLSGSSITASCSYDVLYKKS